MDIYDKLKNGSKDISEFNEKDFDSLNRMVNEMKKKSNYNVDESSFKKESKDKGLFSKVKNLFSKDDDSNYKSNHHKKVSDLIKETKEMSDFKMDPDDDLSGFGEVKHSDDEESDLSFNESQKNSNQINNFKEKKESFDDEKINNNFKQLKRELDYRNSNEEDFTKVNEEKLEGIDNELNRLKDRINNIKSMLDDDVEQKNSLDNKEDQGDKVLDTILSKNSSVKKDVKNLGHFSKEEILKNKQFEKELHLKEKNLKSWEKDLISKQKKLNKKEQELNKKEVSILNNKNKLLEKFNFVLDNFSDFEKFIGSKGNFNNSSKKFNKNFSKNDDVSKSSDLMSNMNKVKKNPSDLSDDLNSNKKSNKENTDLDNMTFKEILKKSEDKINDNDFEEVPKFIDYLDKKAKNKEQELMVLELRNNFNLAKISQELS